MKPISNRYELMQLIAPIQDGFLYIGKDLSLQRLVFVYKVGIASEAAALDYIQRLGSAAQQVAADSLFLHVLDIELGNEVMHIIISYKPGQPLKQFIQQHSLSYRESAALISALGQVCLDAQQVQTPNVSLDWNNVWITEDRMIAVVVSWGCPTTNRILASELARLFVQLIVPNSHHLDLEPMTASELSDIVPIPFDEPTDFYTALAEALHQQGSIASLLQQLKPLADEPAPVVQMDDFYASSPSPAMSDADDMDADEPAHDQRQQRSKLLRSGKRWLLPIAATGVGVIVFAVMMALLIESTGRDTKPSNDKVTVVEPAPQPTVVKPVEEQPKAKEATVVTANQPIVAVPTLTGLSLEAAEDKALESKLRYEYRLESAPSTAGIVFRQEPAPNEQVATGSQVVFWVSKGPAQ
ncbi:MAG: hypothetical protein K0Q59_3352 [Paenibacillus sp.]|jgi:hypothetical protein|nr:hypothetical protein [Paenibacillus sp.]